MAGIRIGGMASGIDTDTMVKQMMQPYLMKVDKQKQDKQIMQWKQDIYRELITDIRGLKNTYMDNIKPEDNLLMQKNYSGYDITSSLATGATGATVATATAGVGVVEGNYIVNVTGLAKGAKIISATTLANTVTNSTKLSELTPSVIDGSDITLTVNGGTPIKITVPTAASMTIQQFTDKVNSETNGTVIARFSELTQKFSFETKGQGKLATLDISGSEGLMKALKIEGLKVPDVNGIITLTQEIGQYAELTVVPPGGDPLNPIPVNNKATNDFTIDGINYSLKGIGTTTLSVTVNTDKTYDKIMGFITKYNELIDKVKVKVEQKQQNSFKPLTDDQKKDMEPDEIKAWEDKAKEGLIKGDSSLNSMLNSMRSAFFDTTGFTTSSDYTQRGKIVIDESLTADEAKKKFSDVLKSNGPGVADLFSKSSETYSEKGIFQKLNTIVEDYTNPFGEKGILLKKAGIKGNTTEFKNLLSEQMIQKDKVISELTKKLAAKEDSFYQKFTRLEVAMNKLNSQSGWLTQQFSSGQ
jgi:flagellar hook-associated protein 2